MASSHSNPDPGNTLFLPLPSTTHQDMNRGGGDGSSMMLEDHHNHTKNITSTGYYFMETTSDAGSCSAKAKIMAHPHYHRLLSAYANCQKVNLALSLSPSLFSLNILKVLGFEHL